MSDMTMRKAADKIREYCGGEGKIQHRSKEFSEIVNYAISQLSAYSIGEAVDVFLTMMNPMVWSTDFSSTRRSLIMVGVPKIAAFDLQEQDSNHSTFEVKLRLVNGNVNSVHAIDDDDSIAAGMIDEVTFVLTR
jgi:hypothetical protein